MMTPRGGYFHVESSGEPLRPVGRLAMCESTQFVRIGQW